MAHWQLSQPLSADYQITAWGHRGSGLMKENFSLVEWMITPEKNGLGYKCIVDEEKPKNNQKDLAVRPPKPFGT